MFSGCVSIAGGAAGGAAGGTVGAPVLFCVGSDIVEVWFSCEEKRFCCEEICLFLLAIPDFVRKSVL